MRIKSYRRSRRVFNFSGSLLRIIAATAVAGMTLAQIKDNRVGESTVIAVPKEKPATVGRPCARVGGYPRPMYSVIERNKANGSIQEFRGSDLSVALEQESYFLALQQDRSDRDIALCFMQAYGELFRLHSPLDELQPVTAKTDEQGNTHVRLRQTYAGIPVRDSEIVVHLSPDRKVYQVEGHYFPTPTELVTQAHLSANEAVAMVRDSFDWEPSTKRRYQTQEAVFVDGNHRARLAYQVNAYGSAGNNWEIWLDANTGAILTKSLLRKSHL
jgi:Zn-dependent metalloprotease